MTNQIRNPNAEGNRRLTLGSDFGLRASFGFRHSDFVIVQRYECRMTNQIRNPNAEGNGRLTLGSDFGHSGFFRHSTFVIRISVSVAAKTNIQHSTTAPHPATLILGRLMFGEDWKT